MKLTITIEKSGSNKTFTTSNVFSLTDWLTSINEATRSEFGYVVSLGAEYDNGDMSWSDDLLGVGV